MTAQPIAPLTLYEPGTKINVAIVDDDATFASFAAVNLGINAPFEVVSMTSGDELLAYREIEELDCIILDFQLETENGLQLAERLRQTVPNLPPIIMLTGTGDERCVIKAFRSGFADYIPKRKLDFLHLQSRVTEAVQNARRNAQREAEILKRQKQQNEQLMFDELTNCFSKNYVLKAMDRLFALNDSTFAVLLIELDTLDDIAKTCGLVVSQKARRSFAQQLRESMRATDIVGRYDEDKFLCILDTDCEAPTILELCKLITDRLSCQINVSGINVRLSARIGGVLLPDLDVHRDNVLDILEDRLEDSPTEGAKYNCGPAVVEINDNQSTGSETATGPKKATDQRRHPRRRILKAANLVSHDSTVSFGCVVRNISEDGALLRFDSSFQLPMSFALRIAGEGKTRNAELRWHSGTDCGVEFVTGGAAHD